MDIRVSELARILVNYSTKVKEGDNVLIQYQDYGRDLATEIFKEVSVQGASPIIVNTPSEATRGYYELVSEDHLEIFPDHMMELVKASDVVISIRSEKNKRYLSSIDPKKISMRSLALRRIHDERLKKRWCLTHYPTSGYAQDADMSLKEYEDFVYSAMIRDWPEERKKMEILKKIMDEADRVRIIGEETDLSMSIRDRTAILSDGTHNVPGGEVFTAPLDDSTNGEIFFDLPAVRYGKDVKDIRLKFERGKIVDCSASKNEDFLKTMINTDKGSNRIGELGIGTNKGINKFTGNILFDEKISETIHLAIGFAYEECGGINKSAIHWDFIKNMKPGEIIIDGKKIQENGIFVWDKQDK
jgi:aminopeptidase